MKIGTRSLLFGCHQFLIHPYYVLKAWIKLYSPPNWKELACIIIHDWGYWGRKDIDGMSGNLHPVKAASLVYKWKLYYFELCLYHSRTMAELMGRPVSKLCWADKLGTVSMPAWLWVLLGSLTKEFEEYRTCGKYPDTYIGNESPYEYFAKFRNKVYETLIQEGFEL